MKITFFKWLLICFVANCLLYSFAQWVPRGRLAKIRVIENCQVTGGDIAIATNDAYGPIIFFCQRTANLINMNHPDAGHFYYVHEFGHHALESSDEREVDCWAAKELANSPNGEYYLRAAIFHFLSRGNEYHPRYGTAVERAERIIRCSGIDLR